jgi:hypothetical protein
MSNAWIRYVTGVDLNDPSFMRSRSRRKHISPNISSEDEKERRPSIMKSPSKPVKKVHFEKDPKKPVTQKKIVYVSTEDNTSSEEGRYYYSSGKESKGKSSKQQRSRKYNKGINGRNQNPGDQQQYSKQQNKHKGSKSNNHDQAKRNNEARPQNFYNSHGRSAQNFSNHTRTTPAMSRLVQPSRSEVVVREDVVEGPMDPRPNAFFDSRTGILRVYHGPVYGNPFSTLVPIQPSHLPIGATVSGSMYADGHSQHCPKDHMENASQGSNQPNNNGTATWGVGVDLNATNDSSKNSWAQDPPAWNTSTGSDNGNFPNNDEPWGGSQKASAWDGSSSNNNNTSNPLTAWGNTNTNSRDNTASRNVADWNTTDSQRSQPVPGAWTDDSAAQTNSQRNKPWEAQTTVSAGSWEGNSKVGPPESSKKAPTWGDITAAQSSTSWAPPRGGGW